MRLSNILRFVTGLTAAPILVAVAIALSACAGANPWNEQNNAGVVTGELQMGLYDKSKVAPYIQSLEFKSGKEMDTFSARVFLKQKPEEPGYGSLPEPATNLPGIEIKATGVRAFEAFRSRADVEKFVAEKFAAAAPEIRKSLVESLSRALGL